MRHSGWRIVLAAAWLLAAWLPSAVAANPFDDTIDQLRAAAAKPNPDKRDYAAMAGLIEKAIAQSRADRTVDSELIDGLRRELPEFLREAGGGDRMFAAYFDYFDLVLSRLPDSQQELDRVVQAITSEYIRADSPERAMDAFEPYLDRPEFAKARDLLGGLIYLNVHERSLHR